MSSRMRRAAAAALAVALGAASFGVAGCTAAPSRVDVAIALPSDSSRWSQVAKVLRDRLGDAGYTVDVRTAADDIPTQVQQVDDLLGADPDVLIVAPVDATSLTPLIDAADPSVDIVSFGALIRDTANLDAYVGWDPGAEGTLQAVSLLQGLGLLDEDGNSVAGGPFRIEVFAGSTDEGRAAPAFAAAMAVLKPYLTRGALTIGSGEKTFDEATTLRGTGATAASRMARILHDDYPDALPDAVLTPSDRIARGVAGALISAGATPGDGFPILSGRGSELTSLAALVSGRQYSTLLEDPRDLAALTADRVLELLAAGPTVTPDPTNAPPGYTVDNGAGPVFAAQLQPVLVRVDDIDELVIGSGYWSQARVDAAVADG